MPKRKANVAVKERTRPTRPLHRSLPAWSVPVVYALACAILFREFVFGSGMLLGTDTQALSYFARNFYTNFVLSFHTFPLWDPLLFGGLPFLDGMHGDIFYPPSLALFFMDTTRMWGWKMVLHVFLAGIFTYIWLRELGLRREIALFGGLVYMCGADLVSLVFPGGDGKLFVSALAPLAFFLTERALSKRRLSDFALLALGVALMVYTSHMQAVYFAIWGISLYAVFKTVLSARAEKKPIASATYFGAFALAGVLGVGAAAIQFLPPRAYLSTYSHRVEQTLTADRQNAYDFATTYSLHPEEIASLAVPEFIGEIPNQYWGRNRFKLNHEYAGFIPLLLLPILFLRRRSPLTWFFAGLGVLALLYALGANTPAFRLFYLIPGVKLFRAPSIIIFLYALSAATLGTFALDRALAWGRGSPEEVRTARRYLWIATGFTGLLAILAAGGVLMQIWQSVVYPGVTKTAQLNASLPFIARGFGITFVVALALTAIWEGFARGVYGSGVAIALVMLLAFLEMYRVDRPFIRITTMNNSPDSPLFVTDEASAFLRGRQQAGEVFRAFIYPSDAEVVRNQLALHGIEQLAGHHGNEIGRYRSLVGGDTAENLGPSDLRLMDVTNTEFLASNALINDPRLQEVYRGNSYVVYRKSGVLPRAYLVGRTEIVPDSLAVQTLLGGRFNYNTTALLAEPLPAGIQIQPDPRGGVRSVERTANAFRLRVESDRPALLVVLDNYYPMWQATVDGRRVPIVRANYTFRAIPIGAGQHDVVFRYVPSNLHTPAIASAIMLLLLGLVGLGGPLAQRFRRVAPAAS
jgi:membrane protein YfhO